MALPKTSKEREEACLRLLKATKTDNEKLAALLLVPKLFSVSLDDDRSNETSSEETCNDLKPVIDKEFQRDLISAIDFQFLKRMLSGTCSDEDSSLTGDRASLKMAALSVVLCFTEDGVLTEDQVSDVISEIESILIVVQQSKIKDDNEESVTAVQMHKEIGSLCIQCLENFARDQDVAILETILIPAMYRVALKNTSRGLVGDQLLQLASNILNRRGTFWLHGNSRLAVTAIYLHQIKISETGAIDFDTCETASKLVYHIAKGSLPEGLHTLVTHVMGKLCDTLKNRLPSAQRQQALKLLTGLIQIRGIADLIKEKGSKAALLVIHLCSIDVRMTLEQDDNEKVVAESETLSSGFFALEQMIFYMAREETTLALDSKEILQVHSALQGAVSAILYFLTGCDTDKPLDQMLFGVIAACVRLLGAWTAEETQSLLSKYTKILPIIIRLCSGMLSEIDCFQFLVPGLSNLSTDTEGIVEVLIDNVDFLRTYLCYCVSQLINQKEEYEHMLVNCCVVILNCLMMPDVKLQPSPVQQLLDAVAIEALKIVTICKNVDCNITIMVTGLAARRKFQELEMDSVMDEDEQKHKEFYSKSIEYMLAISDKEKRFKDTVRSADLPEIWLMGIQVLGDLMKLSPAIKAILIEERIIRQALSLFDRHSSNVDAAFVLEKLLLAMAEYGGAKDLIAKVDRARKGKNS
ncbi:neurochondrin-like [Watersipora subatra]|uniref:neurochondrin-like n=1 Tax=Watersipora subatra TaxID=2589382 RepID=UPI00355C032A